MPPQGLDFFGGKRPSAEEAVEFAAHVAAAEDERIIFLSDVWLDKPGTHDRLRAIFDGEAVDHCSAECCEHSLSRCMWRVGVQVAQF